MDSICLGNPAECARLSPLPAWRGEGRGEGCVTERQIEELPRLLPDRPAPHPALSPSFDGERGRNSQPSNFPVSPDPRCEEGGNSWTLTLLLPFVRTGRGK